MVRGLGVGGFMCLALLGGCGGQSTGDAVDGSPGGGSGGTSGAVAGGTSGAVAGGTSGAGSGGTSGTVAGGTSGASGGTTMTDENECRVTFLDGEQGETSSYVYRFDPEQRTLATRTYFFELDDAGRTLKVSGNQDELPQWYWTDTYDAYGNVTSSDHYTAGTRTYDNVYEDGVTGPRLASVLATGQDFPSVRTTYEYDDVAAPDTWTRSEEDDDDDGEIDWVVTRMLVSGRPESTFVEGPGPSAWHHEYDVDGRIVVVERDSGFWGEGPDGVPNIRWRWTRDDSSNLTRFEQDGTDSFDNPYVNDLPDYAEDYSPGCQPLLTMLPWLGHEPGPFWPGPLFRTSRF